MKYFENFKSVDDVIDQFSIGADDIKSNEILFAYYGYGSYEGGATVLFQRNGKLYEVSGGHCSCNGLEGQWSPEEVTWDQLAMRYKDDYNLGYEDEGGQATAALKRLIRANVPRA